MAVFRCVPLATCAWLLAAMLRACVDAAPAETGFPVNPRPFLAVGHAPENLNDSPNAAGARETTESPADDLSTGRLSTGRLSRRTPGPLLPTAVAGLARRAANTGAGADATAKASGWLVRVPRSSSPEEKNSPDQSTRMLKMISALEDLYRTINGTRSRRLTFMPRANGRNSAKKNKVLPSSEAVSKPTTAPPMETGGTAPRASTGNALPSGRNLKKSIPPPPRRSNKRVCFWKYCSQN